MPGEAIGAQLKLMYAAHHSGRFGTAKIASTALLGLRLGIDGVWGFSLHCPGFQINPRRAQKRAQRESADSQARNRLILLLGNACCQEGEPCHYQEGATDDHCCAELSAHEDALLKN